MNSEIRRTLEAVRDGSLSVDDALLKIKKEPFEDIGYAKIDLHRGIRQGAAEVIYGAGKTAEQMIGIIDLMNMEADIYYDEMGQDMRVEPIPEDMVEKAQEYRAAMIEAIAEQQINEEFVLLKDGVEYTFWGDDVVPVSESRGFQKALQYLEEWLGNNCPDLFEMSRTLLIHEVYLFLPLSYEEEEGKDLALEVVREVSSLMDDGETLQRILKETN